MAGSVSPKTMLIAGIPRAVTSVMPNSYVSAISMGGPCSQAVSCSRQTQATIATSAIGTQCALTLLISASSQTEQELPVDDAEAGAPLDKHRASRGGADLAGKPGGRTCLCRPHPCNERSSSSPMNRSQVRCPTPYASIQYPPWNLDTETSKTLS
ncbi:uncharacterized protein LOC144153060 isoform X3 [Haemaphysalis longicornis]